MGSINSGSLLISTWLDIQYLPHHRSLLIWKVITYSSSVIKIWHMCRWWLRYNILHTIAPNQFLAVQQCQEKSMPSLERENLRPPKQYYHKSLNKVGACTYLLVHVHAYKYEHLPNYMTLCMCTCRSEYCGSSTWQCSNSEKLHHRGSTSPELLRHVAWCGCWLPNASYG